MMIMIMMMMMMAMTTTTMLSTMMLLMMITMLVKWPVVARPTAPGVLAPEPLPSRSQEFQREPEPRLVLDVQLEARLLLHCPKVVEGSACFSGHADRFLVDTVGDLRCTKIASQASFSV